MSFIFPIFVFLFGVCIGSFLNCVIYRLEKKKSLNGRSFCPHCKHNLSWKDLFPILSFLFLKGKCRYCHKKISWQYPLVELATGILFILIFNFSAQGGLASGWQFLNLAFLFYIASVFVIIFVYDLKHYLIPDKVLFPAIFIAFFYRLFENFNIVLFIENWKLEIGNFAPLLNYVLAAVVGSGFFLLIFLVSKGAALGFGDVKLAVLMGLLIGWPGILPALFLAFFFGAIIGLILMVFNKKGLKSEIPFGPFLVAGTFLSLFWGQQIVAWYQGLIL